MKNIKEVQPILTAIFCFNRTNGNEDKDITQLLDYAFRRLYGANLNLLFLACLNKSKEEIRPDVMQLLNEDTKFIEFLEEHKNETI